MVLATFKRSTQAVLLSTRLNTTTHGRFTCPSGVCLSKGRKVFITTTEFPSEDQSALKPGYQPVSPQVVGAFVSRFTFPVESSITTYALTSLHPSKASGFCLPACIRKKL